jgi:hypothetical protein
MDMRTLMLTLAAVSVTACNLVKTKRDGASPPPPASTASDTAPGRRGEQPAVPVPLPPPPPQHLDENQLDLAGNVTAYADFCKQELGLPPATLPPWNCLEGKELPITVDGKPLDETGHAALVAGSTGCDKPSWLGDTPCATYTFVQQRELAPGVVAFLLCRSRKYSTHEPLEKRRADYVESGSFADFRQLYDFDSLGLIWSNLKSGKTCFFDFVGKLYGGYVPSPDDPRRPELADLPEPRPPAELAPGTELERVWKKNGRDTWKPPGEVAANDFCVRCHDAMPFKTSPYIEQVFEIPIPPRDVPFIVVGKLFEPWRKAHPLAAISTTPIGDTPQLCTSCHRIGSQDSCRLHVDYALGLKEPGPLSRSAHAFAARTWMPPMPPDWKSKSEAELERAWHAAYDAHVKKLTCCCKTPQAKGCTRQELDRTPLPEPAFGTGPETCE